MNKLLLIVLLWASACVLLVQGAGEALESNSSTVEGPVGEEVEKKGGGEVESLRDSVKKGRDSVQKLGQDAQDQVQEEAVKAAAAGQRKDAPESAEGGEIRQKLEESVKKKVDDQGEFPKPNVEQNSKPVAEGKGEEHEGSGIDVHLHSVPVLDSDVHGDLHVEIGAEEGHGKVLYGVAGQEEASAALLEPVVGASASASGDGWTGFVTSGRFLLLVLVSISIIVWVVRRNAKLKFALERILTWIRRRAAFHMPQLVNKAMSYLPSFASSNKGKKSPPYPLPRAKYSDLSENQVLSNPAQSDSSVILELKKMSIFGAYVPKMRGTPPGFRSIISDSCLRKLVRELPERLKCKDWLLLYSSELHGYSLLTAYQKAQNMGPFVLVVMDMNRYVFGAFSQQALRQGNRQYYGTGETFVFQMYPNFRVHKWSGKNDQIMVSTKDFIAFGGGKFALWLDPFFDHGSSEEGSTTFEKYQCLASQERFKCCTIEIFGFVNPSTSSPKRTRKTFGGFGNLS